MQRDVQQELNRVEEAQTFTDRRLDELAETVRDVYAKLERLAARISALEDRLDQLGETTMDDAE